MTIKNMNTTESINRVRVLSSDIIEAHPNNRGGYDILAKYVCSNDFKVKYINILDFHGIYALDGYFRIERYIMEGFRLKEDLFLCTKHIFTGLESKGINTKYTTPINFFNYFLPNDNLAYYKDGMQGKYEDNEYYSELFYYKDIRMQPKTLALVFFNSDFEDEINLFRLVKIFSNRAIDIVYLKGV